MKTIKINGLVWNIQIDNNMSLDYFGNVDYFEQTININQKIKGNENIKRTIIHEVIHAYLYSYGFTNKDNFELEQMIEFISHNIANIQKLADEVYRKVVLI